MEFHFAPEEEISFVVQGPIKQKTDEFGYSTYDCINSIKTNYPRSKIILATAPNQILDIKLTSLVSDLATYIDPGQTLCGFIKNEPIFENVNRQIAGTVAGLEKVKTKYAVKIRSDFIVNNNKILGLPILNCGSGRLIKKIVILETFSRFFFHDSCFQRAYTTFHLSDFFFFGYTIDLKKYWTGGQIPASQTRYISRTNYPTIEQKLTRRFYEKNKVLPLLNRYEHVVGNVLDYINLVSEDFCILDSIQIGIVLPKRFRFNFYVKEEFLHSRKFRFLRKQLKPNKSIPITINTCFKCIHLLFLNLRNKIKTFFKK